jgi:PD-(D/E)XK nuclease superfamily protein
MREMSLDLDAPTTKITEVIIGAAIEVHRGLGPGLLESAYQACLAYELVQRNRGIRRLQNRFGEHREFREIGEERYGQKNEPNTSP